VKPDEDWSGVGGMDGEIHVDGDVEPVYLLVNVLLLGHAGRERHDVGDRRTINFWIESETSVKPKTPLGSTAGTVPATAYRFLALTLLRSFGISENLRG
jgi:hypothetical protein